MTRVQTNPQKSTCLNLLGFSLQFSFLLFGTLIIVKLVLVSFTWFAFWCVPFRAVVYTLWVHQVAIKQ